MPGKFTTQSSPSRPGTALERKFSTFENYQVRVAEEGAQIINEKLREKITELDELCMSGKFAISRLAEIREYTTTSVQGYLDEVKRLEKKAAEKAAQGGGNPLLALLAGGMGGGAGADVEGEEGEEMYNPEEDLEAEEIAMPKKLLLSRMGLDEDNKINLKLSLELELPEKAKKSKSAENAKNIESAEKSDKNEKSESKKRENEEVDDVESEEPEPKKARRTTRHSKKSKKSKKGNKADEEEEDIEAETEAEKQETAENKESSMSVTENEKSEEKSAEKNKEKSDEKSKKDEEEEDEEMPVLQSHPEIYKLSTGLRRHIDTILDWIVTIQQWIQSGMTRNKNIGGADIQTEIQNAMLEELGVAAQEFSAHKEIMAAYYISRAAVLEKYVKQPEFEDYKNFLVDEDEKQFVQLRTIVTSMRNSTVNLFDGLTKESETIFNQGSSGKQDNYAAFSMY